MLENLGISYQVLMCRLAASYWPPGDGGARLPFLVFSGSV